MSALNTTNPLKIKCSNCKEPIVIDKVSGGIALFLILAITFPVLIFFHGSENYWLQTVLPVVVAGEIIYFALIKLSIVKIKSA